MTATQVTPRTRARRKAARARARRARAIGVLAQTVAVVIGLGVVGGLLSGGEWPWVAATYLRWSQALVAAVAAAVLLRVGWWRSGVPAALVALALVVSIVVPLRALDTVPAPPGQTLRIGVHNTGFAAGDVAAVAREIRAAELDVVVLLESEDIAEALDRRLDALRRLPAPGPTGRDDAPPVVLARGAWPTTVEPLGGERPATVTRVTLDGRRLDVVAFHPLPPVLRDWSERHRTSISALVGEVLPRSGAHVLACDCNTTPWSPSMRRLLATGLRGPTVRPTFGAPVVGIPLDHVLLSDEVVAVSRELWPFSGSDHRMIVTEVALRPPRAAGR